MSHDQPSLQTDINPIIEDPSLDLRNVPKKRGPLAFEHLRADSLLVIAPTTEEDPAARGRGGAKLAVRGRGGRPEIMGSQKCEGPAHQLPDDYDSFHPNRHDFDEASLRHLGQKHDSAEQQSNEDDAILAARRLKANANPVEQLIKRTGKDDQVPTLFRANNVLSLNECAYLINHATPHVQPLDRLYAQKHRVANRAMFKSKTVAQQIFQRIAPLLTERDYADRIPPCFDSSGVWRPLCINECLKIVRYDQGGHLSQHRDGPWVPREDQCSLLTIVIYLNDLAPDAGGATNFVPHIVGMRTRSSFTLSLIPRAGDATVFEHHLIHGGDPIQSHSANTGKWILRCEMIFQRIASFIPRSFEYTQSENYALCRKLYDESQQAMIEGRKEDFQALYDQVLALQVEAMQQQLVERREARGSTAHHPVLASTDVMAHVLDFLPDRDIVRMMCVSKSMWYTIHLSPVWQQKSIRLCGKQYCDALHLEQQQEEQSQSVPIEEDGATVQHKKYLDWKAIYIGKRNFQNRFSPVVVVATLDEIVLASLHGDEYGRSNRTGGAIKVSFEAIPQVFPKSFELRPPIFTLATNRSRAWTEKMQNVATTPNTLTWAFGKLPPYYGGDKYSYPYHISMPNGERFHINTKSSLDRPRTVVNDSKSDPPAWIEWSMLGLAVDEFTRMKVQHHPVLLVGQPLWYCLPSPPQVHMLRSASALFDVVRTPAVRFLHPAEAAKGAAASHSSGDEELCDVLVVFDGKLLFFPFSPSRSIWRKQDATAGVMLNSFSDARPQQPTTEEPSIQNRKTRLIVWVEEGTATGEIDSHVGKNYRSRTLVKTHQVVQFICANWALAPDVRESCLFKY